MPQKSDVVLSTAEVAVRLGVTTRTVARLFLRGEFPHARKMGTSRTNALAIPEQDVIAYEKKLAALPNKQ